jgi:hypothetical protein
MGEQRYYSKRASGISPIRKDGSLCDPENDRQSEAAEKYAAERLGAKFNSKIYAASGDGGFDFVWQGDKTEVIWLGYRAGTTEPRIAGHLIVNPDEPHRWATRYISVRGSIELGFRLLGWTTHQRLIQEPKKQFGWGLKFAMHTSKLTPISGQSSRQKDIHTWQGKCSICGQSVSGGGVGFKPPPPNQPVICLQCL